MAQGSTPVKLSIDGSVVAGALIVSTSQPGRKELVLQIVPEGTEAKCITPRSTEAPVEPAVEVAAPVVVEPEPPKDDEDAMAGNDDFAFADDDEDEEEEPVQPVRRGPGRPKKNT